MHPRRCRHQRLQPVGQQGFGGDDGPPQSVGRCGQWCRVGRAGRVQRLEGRRPQRSDDDRGVRRDRDSAERRPHRRDHVRTDGRRTLGVTYTWHWSTGGYESDIAFNTNVPWFQAASEGSGCYAVNAYDFQSAATHEIGHMYGLDHVPAPYNTMYYAMTRGETYKRSPAAGDALGLRAIYG
ncbi:MAG: matrixin family metalloprotease [Acidimicrobiia bacterium]|nr:matrixin family metalloprotease [Acidimicrobiia bacterium]